MPEVPASLESGPGLCERDQTGPICAEIVTGLVQRYARLYGKGPTRAKARIVPDAVICVLADEFTPVERSLIEGGDIDAVRSVRGSLHAATTHDFRSVVEEATGREVVAHMSQIHANPDVAVELFFFGGDHEV